LLKSVGATVVPLAAARDFDAVPIAALVAEANRSALRPIRLADASLGAQRVSGRFRVDDPELLARRLGALFGRAVDVGDPREIVLASATDEGVRSRRN
jgi:transmembrane sensor